MSWLRTIFLSFWSSLVEWWRSSLATRKQTEQSKMFHDFHFPSAAHKTERNKAYADQHQKAKHNRRRKLSKAMRNLYKL